MGTIQIECSPAALFSLFETTSVSLDMSREVPGGATICLRDMPLQKRHLPEVETLVTIAVTVGSGVAINLFSNWLYDRLKDAKNVRTLKINRIQVDITPESITKVVAEAIELQEDK